MIYSLHVRWKLLDGVAYYRRLPGGTLVAGCLLDPESCTLNLES